MKYNQRDISVVWIDLDDTLIDFHANSRASLTILYNNACPGEMWPDAQSWIQCYEKHNKALWELYNGALITKDYLMMERFSRPLIEGGMVEAEARELSPRLSDMYLHHLALQKNLMPHSLELLRYLRSHGLTVGVLSNGFKEVQYRKIRSAGIEDLIDIVVLSDDIGINKPDIRLYRYAMDRSGITDPERHLMIGDNPSTDIAGALGAGWSAIAYNPTLPQSPISHDGYLEVGSLLQIPPLFR